MQQIPPERRAYYKAALLDLHVALADHELTAQFLDGTNIKSDGKMLSPEQYVELDFDGKLLLAVQDFAQLFCVFSNSRAHIQIENRHGNDLAPPGVYVTVINPKIIESGHKNKLGLFKEESGATGLAMAGLFVDHFMLNKSGTPPLLGTVAFALSALQSYLLGLDKIELIAAGGAGYSKKFYGYHIWPKFGFDAPIEPGEFTEKAPKLATCLTVQQAMATSESCWEQHGSQRLMTFDLAPDSVSWRKLLSYTRVKRLWSTP